MATEVAKTLTPEEEIANKLSALEMLKGIFISHFDTKKIEEWPGDKGPMYNLWFKNANALSPFKEFMNKEGVAVPLKTIGDLAGAVVDNLRHSGYWINFKVDRPDGRGGLVPTDITMWSYAKAGFIVCKGKEQFASAITGSVSKSQPKQPKVVDASGNETTYEKVNLNLGLFASNKGNVGQTLNIS